jgi:cysteine-rich repeat protein
VCGDGVIDWNEMCDDGNTLPDDGCSPDCQWVLPGLCTGRFCNDPSNCGDGQRQLGEECDSGSQNEDGRYGGCSTQCTLNERCGDGIVQYEELCDLGINNQDNVCGGCTTQCQPYPFCGDNILQAECGEVCDDGVNSGYPGFCSPGCMTPRCGDGILQPENREECDVGSGDGSMRPWPHCSMCRNVYMN